MEYGGTVVTEQNDTEAFLPEQGVRFLTDFWEKKYFQEYIRDGGSKIRFVTGRKGSGKTYLLECLMKAAERQGFKTVEFSARDIWLHDFREFYV